jgi:hypothetical protein
LIPEEVFNHGPQQAIDGKSKPIQRYLKSGWPKKWLSTILSQVIEVVLSVKFLNLFNTTLMPEIL